MMSDVEKQHGAGPHANGSMKSDELGRRLDGIDPVFEAKLVRKLDLSIIPVVMLLYLLSFLDRSVPSLVIRFVALLDLAVFA